MMVRLQIREKPRHLVIFQQKTMIPVKWHIPMILVAMAAQLTMCCLDVAHQCCYIDNWLLQPSRECEEPGQIKSRVDRGFVDVGLSLIGSG